MDYEKAVNLTVPDACRDRTSPWSCSRPRSDNDAAIAIDRCRRSSRDIPAVAVDGVPPSDNTPAAKAKGVIEGCVGVEMITLSIF